MIEKTKEDSNRRVSAGTTLAWAVHLRQAIAKQDWQMVRAVTEHIEDETDIRLTAPATTSDPTTERR